MIQRAWRKKVKMDFGRKKLLFALWDKAKNKMLERYLKKGKKYINEIKNLQRLTEEIKEKVMTSCFVAAQKKYLQTLSEWFKKRDKLDKAKKQKMNALKMFTMKQSNAGNQGVLEVLKQERKSFLGVLSIKNKAIYKKSTTSANKNPSNKNIVKKEEEMNLMVLPTFEYCPSDEELINMILKAAKDLCDQEQKPTLFFTSN